MAQPQRASFSTLPAEMVANVFAFIRRKVDMRAISLVSRAWQDAIAPIMWEELVSDFRSSNTKPMSALLNPQSGIHPHVRVLNIKDAAEDPDRENSVRLFISMLPTDTLRDFVSSKPISLITLQLLVKCQRQLQCFMTQLNSQDEAVLSDTITSLKSYSWAPPLLSRITKYAFYVPVYSGATHQDSEAFTFMVRTMSELKVLQIRIATVRGIDPSTQLLSSHLPQEECEYRFTHLKHLFILGLNLSACSKKLFGCLNFKELTQLSLIGCEGTGTFLYEFRKAMAQESGHLTKFRIWHPWYLTRRAEVQQALEDFLRQTSGFQWLELDVGPHGLVSKECFFSHAKTLNTLILSTGWSLDKSYYSNSDLAEILRQCQGIRELAVNMPSIDLGSLMDLGADFCLGASRFATAHVATKFESILTTLASHKSLHTFRILSLPDADYITTTPPPDLFDRSHITDQEGRLCQALMQSFANEVVRYMCRAHSGLHVFSLSPGFRPAIRPATDANGHRWPLYTYIKRRIVNGAGAEEVIAAPLACPELEMPASAVITYKV